jgi:hypothetical protein
VRVDPLKILGGCIGSHVLGTTCGKRRRTLPAPAVRAGERVAPKRERRRIFTDPGCQSSLLKRKQQRVIEEGSARPLSITIFTNFVKYDYHPRHRIKTEPHAHDEPTADGRLESGRRNSFLARVEKDGEMNLRAVQWVKTEGERNRLLKITSHLFLS